MAVSKGVPAERLVDAVAAGSTLLGENRVQEAETKVGRVPGATWHLVGRLQRNKAARAAELFAVIESVDSLELARRLDRIAGEARGQDSRLPIFLQVNVDADPAKAGFAREVLNTAIDELASLRGLELLGLMTVGRLGVRPDDSRATFRGLRQVSEDLRARRPSLGAGLSMGMSDDFEVAVEEGATVVRIGRALFGARPHG